MRAWSVLVAIALLFAASVPAQGGDEASTGEVVDAVAAGPAVEERLAEIRLRIQDALVYPPIARARRLEGVARVRFAIRRDGSAEGVEVAASSGHRMLDRAAARSVRRAAPLPWVYGRLEVPVRFALEDVR